MFPGFTPHFNDCPDFLTGVLCVIIIEHIFENGEIIFSFRAVYIVIDCDEADVVSWKNEIL